MRVSEDRYVRDLRRLNLAQRLIRHRVRTQWICAFTGLTAERVRNLYRSYVTSLGLKDRQRGPSPTRPFMLVRSALLHSEASALAGIVHKMRLIPPEPLANATRALRGVEVGEKLCEIFELYHHIVEGATFTMEQLILLVVALTERKDLDLCHCESCQALLVTSREGATRPVCSPCRKRPRDPLDAQDVREDPGAHHPAPGYQHSLF